MNEFEQKLSRQPLRQIPGEWRAEILAAADANRREDVRACTSAATIRSRMREIFWPHPKAWAGLAAVWVCILLLNFSTREKTQPVAEKTASPPPPEMVAELKKQKLMFAELMGAAELRVADRQKTYLPKPQSKRAEILTA